MNKIIAEIANGIITFTNRSLIKNLIIITLCILLSFSLAFFPFQYYESANKGKADFQVGIHYVFEQDEENQIYGQVGRIHDLGFKVIRITMECETNPLDYNNIQKRCFL